MSSYQLDLLTTVNLVTKQTQTSLILWHVIKVSIKNATKIQSETQPDLMGAGACSGQGPLRGSWAI